MGILSSFFDVVAGVSILAGRSSLLDTTLTQIAGRNFTVRGALGLSFLSVGFINLMATSRRQSKIERLSKEAETDEHYGADTTKEVMYVKQMKEEFYDKKNAYEMYEERTHNYGYFTSKPSAVKDAEESKAYYESKGYYVELFEGSGGVIYVKTTLNKDISIETRVVISYSPIVKLGAETFNAPAAVMRTYKGRKSPSISAKSVKVGTRKRGNDGKMWQVRSVKSRGKRTQRWFKD